MTSESARHALRLDTVSSARSLFQDCLAWLDSNRETLWVAHLDQRGDCVRLDQFEGDAESVTFPMRQILAAVVECDSACLILAHNHPSGDPTPSQSDIKATRRLVATAKGLDCAVLDHLILADAGYTSFRELGLL